jgi:hypothetical protein
MQFCNIALEVREKVESFALVARQWLTKFDVARTDRTFLLLNIKDRAQNNSYPRSINARSTQPTRAPKSCPANAQISSARASPSARTKSATKRLQRCRSGRRQPSWQRASKCESPFTCTLCAASNANDKAFAPQRSFVSRRR